MKRGGSMEKWWAEVFLRMNLGDGDRIRVLQIDVGLVCKMKKWTGLQTSEFEVDTRL
jgi:hypothetical protein